MTILLNPQYVVDKEKNRKAVILTIDEWERIVEDLEELDDIRVVPMMRQKRVLRIRFPLNRQCERSKGNTKSEVYYRNPAFRPKRTLKNLTSRPTTYH
jgi:hypothetical protein